MPHQFQCCRALVRQYAPGPRKPGTEFPLEEGTELGARKASVPGARRRRNPPCAVFPCRIKRRGDRANSDARGRPGPANKENGSPAKRGKRLRPHRSPAQHGRRPASWPCRSACCSAPGQAWGTIASSRTGKLNSRRPCPDDGNSSTRRLLAVFPGSGTSPRRSTNSSSLRPSRQGRPACSRSRPPAWPLPESRRRRPISGPVR